MNLKLNIQTFCTVCGSLRASIEQWERTKAHCLRVRYNHATVRDCDRNIHRYRMALETMNNALHGENVFSDAEIQLKGELQ